MSAAIQHAAESAWQETESLLAEAQHALTLHGESITLYNHAADAIDAYPRAVARAEQLQRLADDDRGGYNAFEDAS